MTPKLKPGRPVGSLSSAISEAILAAATAAFLEEGYDGVSMEAVAARAGVPKSTLYKRYSDKKSLLRAVLEARRAAWSSEASRNDWKLNDNLQDRLTYYAQVILTWAGSPEVRAFSALATSAWSRPEDAPSQFELLGLTEMLDLLERDIRTFGPGAGVRAADPRRAATLLMATLAGWSQMRGPAAPPSEQEMADAASQVVEVLLRGGAAW